MTVVHVTVSLANNFPRRATVSAIRLTAVASTLLTWLIPASAVFKILARTSLLVLCRAVRLVVIPAITVEVLNQLNVHTST